MSTLPDRIVHALVAAFMALVFGGWYTVILGAVIGGIVSLSQGRLLPTIGDDMSDIVEAGTDKVSDFAHRRPVPAFALGLVLLIVLLLLVVGSWVWFVPLATGGLSSKPNPTQDYQTALKAIQGIQEAEDRLAINPECRTKMLTHSRPTEKAIVYIHGFTNCPAQFDQLGQQLSYLGYNVFVPRMPHHGLADLLTGDLSYLTAEELVKYADSSVDIAQGLGEQVTVVGLSGGGSIAG